MATNQQPRYDPSRYGGCVHNTISRSAPLRQAPYNTSQQGSVAPSISSRSPDIPKLQDITAWARVLERSRPLLRSLRKSPVLFNELEQQLRGLARMEVERAQASEHQKIRQHRMSAVQL